MGGADFTSYLVARWPTLVRTLVMLGATPAEADQLARQAMADCHPGFDRVGRDGDVDVHVYRRLVRPWLQEVAKGGTSGYRPVGDAAVLDPTVVDPHARVALLAALQQAVGALPLEHRLVVVLSFVAELDVDQVADVMERSAEDVTSARADALTRLRPEALAREHL